MIVLYNPWSTPSPKKPTPMSLLAVASMLEGEHEYEIVDGNLVDDPVDRIITLAVNQPITAIGITVMPGPQLNHAVPDSRRLKAALPGVPIIWGGYFATHHADTILKDSAIDFCVLGQGEQTFLELSRLINSGGDIESIPGIAYRSNGTVHRNIRRNILKLDDLPVWPFHRVPFETYLHKHYLGSRVTAYHSSFGCPFACNFCAVVEMSNRRWAAESPSRVAGTLKFLQDEYRIDAVQFHDMDFFIHEDRTAEIADRIAPLELTWWGLGRVDELMDYSDSTWQAMKESGLKMVFCGAESGSEAVLKRMNKGGRVAPGMTLDLARRMKEFDVVPEFSFVVGNPPDPVSDLDATLGFIRKLKQINPAAEIILYAYTPVAMDGTLYADAREMGFRFPETLDAWTSGIWREFALRRDPKTPWLNMDIKRRMRNFERVLNAYYPTTTDTRLTGLRRSLLKSLGWWRYKTEFYSFPIELMAVQKIFKYQRPEVTGF